MHLKEINSIAGDVIQAMQQGRIGFAVQEVNAVEERTDVLYSECLARLVAPDGIVIPAGAFIPALEALGRAPELDRYILNLAFDWMYENTSGSLGCNVSTQNFLNMGCLELLYDQLYLHRSLAPRMVLEITESVPITLCPSTVNLIQELRKLGYRVAVDDFGKGFLTPDVLFSVAVDVVKIDGFFVGLSKRQSPDRILKYMVGLASCATSQIVVEGVETYEHLALAKGAGATHVQGYLLSKPRLSPIYQGAGRKPFPLGVRDLSVSAS